MIRRRRECVRCERRFTSYEKIERQSFQVVKQDQRREPYDREKLMRGLIIACRKRAVSVESLERVADRFEAAIHESGKREISSREIGNYVMHQLRELDSVAYIRFASVYRRFDDLEEFIHELSQLKDETR